MTDFDPIQQIQQAQKTISELNLPTHLEAVAFEYLLNTTSDSNVGKHRVPAQPAPLERADTSDLRAFTSSLGLKGAVAEIPALLYWARLNEELDIANERDVIELYRRAGMRPPKDIAQSFRDLCKKKYFRLEPVEGQRGQYRLSRAGEDFVIHDLIPKKSV